MRKWAIDDENLVHRAEVDLTGDGYRAPYQRFKVAAGATVAHEFPEAFSADWIRSRSDQDTKVTALLDDR